MINKKIFMTLGLVLMMGVSACNSSPSKPSESSSSNETSSEPISESPLNSEESLYSEIDSEELESIIESEEESLPSEEPVSEEESVPFTSEEEPITEESVTEAISEFLSEESEPATESHDASEAISETISEFVSESEGESKPYEGPKVSEEYWNKNIKGYGFFGKDFNMTFNFTNVYAAGQVVSGFVANDNGVLELHSGEESGMYIVPLEDGSYTVYTFDGTMVTLSKEEIEQSLQAIFIGVYLPWDYDLFTFDEASMSYHLDSYKAVIYGDSAIVKNIDVTFYDGQLKSISYQLVEGEALVASFRVNVTNIGTTEVKIPDPGQQQEEVPVTGINLNKTEIVAELGDAPVTLTATVLPENATNPSVTWRSGDESVALVHEGVVYFAGVGETYIYAIAGNVTANCHVKVSEKGEPEPVSYFSAGTFKYINDSFDGATDYLPDAGISKEWVNKHMAHVTLSLFDDGIEGEDGQEGTAPTFELYYLADDRVVQYLFNGTYYVSEEENAVLFNVEAYYNGSTGRWYHNDHLNNLNQPCFDINTAMWFDEEVGQYLTNTYIDEGNGANVYAKGDFAFKKVDSNPTHASGIPSDPHDDMNYEAMVEGKTYRFTYIGSTSAEINSEAYRLAYETSSIEVFEDNYMEYNNDYLLVENLIYHFANILRGSYRMDETADGDVYIEFMKQDVVLNDEVLEQSGSTYFVYDREADKIYLLIEFEEGTLEVHYEEDRGVIPERYVPELPDVWDDEAIALNMSILGINDTLPSLGQVRAFGVSDVDEESLSFYVQAIYSKVYPAGINNYITYTNELSSKYGFDPVISEDESYIYYISPNGEYELHTDIDTETNPYYPIITLLIKKRVVYYPEDEIAAYLRAFGATDEFVDFRADDAVQYDFSEDMQALYIFYKEGADGDEMLSAYLSQASDLGYYLYNPNYEADEETPIYISPNEQIALSMTAYVYEGTPYIIAAFGDAANFVKDVYPEEDFLALVEGVSDEIPSFETSYAKQYDVQGANQYTPLGVLSITLRGKTNGVALAREFNSELQKLGYTRKSFTVVMNYGTEEERDYTPYGDYLVSPNNEVAFNIVGATKDADYPGYVTINVINFKNYKVKIQGEPALEYITVTGYKDTYNVGDEFIFDGVVTAYYDDETSKEISNESISIDDYDLDMSVEGIYDVTIEYTEKNITVSEVIEITVVVPDPVITSIRVEMEDGTGAIFGVGDDFFLDGTVYAVYDNGDELELSEEEYSLSNLPNMDKAGTYTVTVSYITGEGSVFTAEVDIEVVEVPTLVSITASNYVCEYIVGDEYSFNGDVLATYSDGGHIPLYDDEYVLDTSKVDMSKPGTYEVVISFTEKGITVSETIEIRVFMNKVDYAYTNTDAWDITCDNAIIKVFAWGGEYGDGQWIDVSIEDGVLYFSLYANCDGFKIVRFNPTAKDIIPTEGGWPEELNAHIWNQTGNIAAANVTGEFYFG